jgi:hypothetical protein
VAFFHTPTAAGKKNRWMDHLNIAGKWCVMYESLMKSGNHRVDYFNEDARGKPQSYAFYVSGDLPGNSPYSRTAKHQLLAGLMVIENTFGLRCLVGIYLDIASPLCPARPALQRLKEDLQAGYFNRAVIYSSENTESDPAYMEDMEKIKLEISGFELVILQPFPQNVEE